MKGRWNVYLDCGVSRSVGRFQGRAFGAKLQPLTGAYQAVFKSHHNLRSKQVCDMIKCAINVTSIINSFELLFLPTFACEKLRDLNLATHT